MGLHYIIILAVLGTSLIYNTIQGVRIRKYKREKQEGKPDQEVNIVIEAELIEDGLSPYERVFLKKADGMAREGKSVYISKDHHKMLLRIIQVIGQNKVSLYDYVANILDYHFSFFREELEKTFTEKNTNLFD